MKQCKTCKYFDRWQDGIAGLCNHPLPEVIAAYLRPTTEISRRGFIIDGKECPCWAEVPKKEKPQVELESRDFAGAYSFILEPDENGEYNKCVPRGTQLVTIAKFIRDHAHCEDEKIKGRAMFMLLEIAKDCEKWT